MPLDDLSPEEKLLQIIQHGSQGKTLTPSQPFATAEPEPEPEPEPADEPVTSPKRKKSRSRVKARQPKSTNKRPTARIGATTPKAVSRRKKARKRTRTTSLGKAAKPAKADRPQVIGSPSGLTRVARRPRQQTRIRRVRATSVRAALSSSLGIGSRKSRAPRHAAIRTLNILLAAACVILFLGFVAVVCGRTPEALLPRGGAQADLGDASIVPLPPFSEYLPVLTNNDIFRDKVVVAQKTNLVVRGGIRAARDYIQAYLKLEAVSIQPDKPESSLAFISLRHPTMGTEYLQLQIGDSITASTEPDAVRPVLHEIHNERVVFLYEGNDGTGTILLGSRR